MTEAILTYMNTVDLAPSLPSSDAEAMAAELGGLSGMDVYPRSITAIQQSILFFGRQAGQKYLGCLATADSGVPGLAGQTKPVTVAGQELTLTVAPNHCR